MPVIWVVHLGKEKRREKGRDSRPVRFHTPFECGRRRGALFEIGNEKFRPRALRNFRRRRQSPRGILTGQSCAASRSQTAGPPAAIILISCHGPALNNRSRFVVGAARSNFGGVFYTRHWSVGRDIKASCAIGLKLLLKAGLPDPRCPSRRSQTICGCGRSNGSYPSAL
jgi:hypothetical protein